MTYWYVKVTTVKVLVATFFVFAQIFSNFLRIKTTTFFYDFASITYQSGLTMVITPLIPQAGLGWRPEFCSPDPSMV